MPLTFEAWRDTDHLRRCVLAELAAASDEERPELEATLVRIDQRLAEYWAHGVGRLTVAEAEALVAGLRKRGFRAHVDVVHSASDIPVSIVFSGARDGEHRVDLESTPGPRVRALARLHPLPRLSARPLTLRQANALVERLHRRRDPEQGHRFSIGAFDERARPVGAVIVGRPKAQFTEQYLIAEVSRCVTDGTPNACSFLYGRAARAAEAEGYNEIQTFTDVDEPGITMRAAGWLEAGVTTGEGGRGDGRPKRKWRKVLRRERQQALLL